MTDHLHTPESRESERALLGAILIDPSIMNRVSIPPEAFYDTGNQEIYRSMRAIGSRDLDLLSLAEVLDRKKKLEDIGGRSYLTKLPNECPQSYNFETYERIIRDTSIRRFVINAAGQLAKEAYNEQSDITDAISKAVSDLVQSAKPKGGAVAMKEYLTALYADISERAENPKEVYGLETGMRGFDKITYGLQTGEEFIISGQPGTGKSLLAFQLGCGAASHGHAGAVYALEMSGKAMIRRRLSAVTKIPTYNMRSGIEMNSRWDKLNQGVEQLEQLPIFISDATDWTTLQLRADLSRLKQQQGVEWFILDYLDLLVDNFGRDKNERSEYLSRQIHGICKELDLSGIVVQSLNKQGYGANPNMSHLSGSHKVSYDTDTLAILSKDEKEENVVNLVWDKMREAEGKRALKLVWIPELPALGEYAKNENGFFRDYTK